MSEWDRFKRFVDGVAARSAALATERERSAAEWLLTAGEPAPLDSIDQAYREQDNPARIVRSTRAPCSADYDPLIIRLRELDRFGHVILPPGYDVQVIGPMYSCASPFELARWADDGGRV